MDLFVYADWTMKGIAHFISGVTAASLCPWAIVAAQNGNPVYFILGAVAGILPDTIDFKFYRFFYRHDVRVEPDSRVLDPQPIADAVALCVSAAAEGRVTSLKLSTIQTGPDSWRQYRVKIDPLAGEVRVQFGPVVSTGQVPLPGTWPRIRPVGAAPLSAPVVQSYDPVYSIDIFDGPSFKFSGNEEGQVDVDFLPWHRNWSHALPVGGVLAVITACFDWRAGIVVCGAYVVHVLEDQLGYMGSNLFFPFSKKRIPGMKIMHSGDALPNFMVVWGCCLLIFWNIYAAIDHPLYHFSFGRFVMMTGIIPFGLFGAVHWLLTRSDTGNSETSQGGWDL